MEFDGILPGVRSGEGVHSQRPHEKDVAGVGSGLEKVDPADIGRTNDVTPRANGVFQ